MIMKRIPYCQDQKRSMKINYETREILADRCRFEIPDYMFHIGDYVKTVDGLIGVIDDVCSYSKRGERGFQESHIKYINGEGD